MQIACSLCFLRTCLLRELLLDESMSIALYFKLELSNEKTESCYDVDAQVVTQCHMASNAVCGNACAPVLQNNLLAAWSKSLVLSSTHLVRHSHTALMLYSLAETTAPGNIPADNKCWENTRGIHLFGTNSCAQETPNRISTKANKRLWLVDILQKKNWLWSNIFHWLSRPLYCW